MTSSSVDSPHLSDETSADQSASRIRELNEKIIESAKSAGTVSLDAYEKALSSLLDFETQVASASQLDWVSAVASTHAKFVQDVSSSYIASARDLLK